MNKLAEWIDNAASFIMALFVVLVKELFVPGIIGLTAAMLIVLLIRFLVTENWAGIVAITLGVILFAVGVYLTRSVCRRL